MAEEEATGPAPRRPPRVFISYAHDTPEHEEAVRRFYELLRVDCGIDAIFDRVAAQSPRDWTVWMGRTMAEVDFVLAVVSPHYRAAADAELAPDVRRGAQWETRLLREEFNRNEPSARARILPVVLPGAGVDDIPAWMSPTAATHYRIAELTRAGAETLLRYLVSQPAYVEPVLGPLVDFTTRTLRLNLRRGTSPGATEVTLSDNGTDIATHQGRLPTSDPWLGLRAGPAAADTRLGLEAQELGKILYGGEVGAALAAAIDATPAGSSVDLGVVVGDGVGPVALELAALADGRSPALEPVVRLHRVAGKAVAAQPGPLKILVAVGAPDETSTTNAPLDLEAELEAIMAAVADVDASGVAQVRILEVASLAEITKASTTTSSTCCT